MNRNLIDKRYYFRRNLSENKIRQVHNKMFIGLHNLKILYVVYLIRAKEKN